MALIRVNKAGSASLQPIESNENGSGSLTSTFTFNGVSAVPTNYILEAQVYRSSDSATQHAPYISAPTFMPLTGSTTNTPPDHIAYTNGAISGVTMSLSGDVLSVTATSNGAWNIKSGVKAYLTILS